MTTAHPKPAPSTEQLLRQRNTLPPDHPDRPALRAQAIEASLPLAEHLARRYAGRGVDHEDLTQVAALALVKAVDGYDPTRGVPFGGYAIPSIVGALKRHFRDTAWGMRVPRDVQDLVRTVGVATGDLSQTLGRSPTCAELAAHCHVTVEDVLNAVAASQAYHLASLHVPAGDGSGDLVDLLGAEDPGYAGVDDHVALRPLFVALPDLEKQILAMRYYGGMTQAQIGREIGVSQMHVSRLLRRALAQLRTWMD